jgi:hypothetical protein
VLILDGCSRLGAFCQRDGASYEVGMLRLRNEDRIALLISAAQHDKDHIG